MKIFGFDVARIGVGIAAAAMFFLNPRTVATLSLIAGVGLTIAGVYVLVGIGWALLAGAAPLLLLAGVLIMGLIRGG